MNQPTEAHWHLATEAINAGPTKGDQVRAIAQALADVEQAARDDVRFGSAYCPDCGAYADYPHVEGCDALTEDHSAARPVLTLQPSGSYL